MVLKKHELLEVIKKELYTPVVGDILDQMGLYHQFLPQAVRPLRDDMKLAGYAMTVLMIDVFGQQKKPFGYLTEALDDLQEDEIYVAAGGTMRCAYWGELLTATAKKRGAAGAVVNGWHRDTPQVLDQNWPVFSRGDAHRGHDFLLLIFHQAGQGNCAPGSWNPSGPDLQIPYQYPPYNV